MANLFRDKVGVEVGVERGKYSRVIMEAGASKLYAVDLWKNYDGYREHVDDGFYESIFMDAQENLKKFNVEFIRKESLAAAMDFEDESLDFLYLDSNHQFEFVLHDLFAWVPKIRKNGVVSGHDYKKTKDFGVIEALSKYQEQTNAIDELVIYRGDKTPSWMFIKQ